MLRSNRSNHHTTWEDVSTSRPRQLTRLMGVWKFWRPASTSYVCRSIPTLFLENGRWPCRFINRSIYRCWLTAIRSRHIAARKGYPPTPPAQVSYGEARPRKLSRISCTIITDITSIIERQSSVARPYPDIVDHLRSLLDFSCRGQCDW